MDSFFGSDFFIGNRKRLRELFAGTAPIVITANGLLQRNGDVTFPFRQDSSFWYLTGIDEPDIILVMDKTKDYLIVPGRNTNRAVFDGTVDTVALSTRSGINEVLDDVAGWKQLTNRLKKVTNVATLAAGPSYLTGHGYYTNPARSTLTQKLQDTSSSIELLDIRQHLMRLRLVKQPQELQALQAAIDLTIKAFKLAPKWLKTLNSEHELEAELTKLFRSARAHHAYQPIIAGGSRACTLHYIANDHVIDPKQLLLIDAGAEIEHYAADITRTFLLSPSSKRQKQVLTTVADIQDYALSLLKPGISMHEYEKQVEVFAGEKLRALGLIKTVEHEQVRKFYPHATSHFLGLDVHDVGDYERPLEAGNVITVEPGIYIPEEGIGVRIEDNVVITKSGHKMLSQKLPRMLE